MLYRNEEQFHRSGIVAGVDEAGRGPLAGPVVCAAVILRRDRQLIGLNDSKKLTAEKREYLFEKIKDTALAWSVQFIDCTKIDEINILQATMLGMEKAVNDLQIQPQVCLIDGNRVPQNLQEIAIPLVKGDMKYASIAAASILAKVSRDLYMKKLHREFPRYNFEKNKGYPTREHLLAIEKFGICPHHRRSFKPISRMSGL